MYSVVAAGVGMDVVKIKADVKVRGSRAILRHNAPHHLPAEAGEARCNRSGAWVGRHVAFWRTSLT